jgi:Ca2+-binding RTX toxin-like protein
MRISRRLSIAAAMVVVTLGVAAPAYASYTAKITGGVLTFSGNGAGDKLVLRLKAGSPGKLQADVGANGSADFQFARSLFTAIVVNAGGGNDTVLVSEAHGVFTTSELTTLNGGSGNDKLAGGSGAENLAGGVGVDTLVGKDGNDSFAWSAGQGSDAIDGQNGTDSLSLVGTDADELFTLLQDASVLNVQAGPALVVGEAVESVSVAPLGGVDQVVVNDLTGAGVDNITVDLAVAGQGDGQSDNVTLNGTGSGDVVAAAGVGADVSVTGLPTSVLVQGAEAANDRLTINGLGGNDTLSGGSLAALMQLSFDGGDGGDALNGGNGADTLIGGTGNDVVDGNQGNDVVFLGDGNDQARWDPGDGSDIVEGQVGDDTLLFNGSAGAEIFAASANGGRLLFTRNVGNIVMDTDDVEHLQLNTLGGADTVTVNGLSPTDVGEVSIDLGVTGLGDGAADAVTVNGSTGVDLVSVSGGVASVALSADGLALTLAHAEPANDDLTVNLNAGADLFSASGLASSSVQLTVNGGADADVLVGSQGGDTINGDAGNDVIQGENGNDTLDGGADTDYIDGGAGIDTAANGETVVNVP